MYRAFLLQFLIVVLDLGICKMWVSALVLFVLFAFAALPVVPAKVAYLLSFLVGPVVWHLHLFVSKLVAFAASLAAALG